jgi:phosphate/sulfate permease
MVGADTIAIAERIARLSSRALRRIAETARTEAPEDANRVLLGVATFALAFVLCAHAVALIHAVLVLALIAVGVSAVEAFAALLAVDLVVVLVAVAIGRRLVWQPLLPRTRAQIQQLEETYELLVG